METNGRHLAETYLAMLNTHQPDLVDRFVSETYRTTTPSSPTVARRTASSGPPSSAPCPISAPPWRTW